MFNETLNNCALKDLGYTGHIFTWANNQSDKMHIQERIDRYCANSNWLNLFLRYINIHLLRYTSDHNPILLEFHEASTNIFNYNHTKIQKFEQMWAQDQESVQIVKKAWNNSTDPDPMKLK